jgi:hypothetical protein
MPALIFLTPLIVLAFAFRRTPGWLFVAIYLPALPLVPDTFHTTTIGIPKMSVNEAVIVTIVPFVPARHGATFRPHFTDLLVAAMATLMCVSEYQAAGYNEAQNLAFRMFSSAIAPYLCARLLLPAERLDVPRAKKIVLLTASIVVVSTFEFKFDFNPFLAIGGALFPNQGGGWVTTFRHGFARIAGPFAHAILAGMMMALAYRLQRWLKWGGHWEPRFAALPRLPWTKARCISGLLLLGALVPLAGRARNRRRVLLALAAAGLLVLPLAYLGMRSYLEVKPGMALTLSQESALYRKVLIDEYTDIALDHAMLGWGRNTWPKVASMSSIDNYFPLLSLMHGVWVTLLLLALFLWQGVRLFALGCAAPSSSNSLAFTMAGILVAVLVSLLTVYLGEQLMPMLFLIFGWSESIVARRPATDAPPAVVGHGADATARGRVIQAMR